MVDYFNPEKINLLKGRESKWYATGSLPFIIIIIKMINHKLCYTKYKSSTSFSRFV